MLLLDTDGLPHGDRVDAFRAVATAGAGTRGIEHEADDVLGFRKRPAAGAGNCWPGVRSGRKLPSRTASGREKL
ncbi:hypothetical protein [Nonomuraea jabiensis]|uniref:hypothetical protein n=1 Tax=Nonomuraea jabiensis TaxID=882448 RepID=UPI003D73FB6C